ncbi:MAG TPA: tRNA (adenosine(37)-N6)-threonylcarbamoyltransferase complex dimerization subunit type 1 TsaB [Ignavibacteria bacterium]
MKILLIETSFKLIEFGYAEGIELKIDSRLKEGENADTLVYYIKKEFDEQAIDVSGIDIVSISNGPGSFTGLRVGAAITKGICFVNKSRLIEVPTLDIIANKYKISNAIQNSKKIITSMVFSNLRTNEFYLADFEITNGELKRISDYKIETFEEMKKENRIFLVNDVYPAELESTIEIVSIIDGSNIPSQLDIALKMIEQGKFSDYTKSEPFYMKEFIPLGKSR